MVSRCLSVLQSSLGLRLDHRSHIFQNLNGAKDEVDLRLSGPNATVVNTIYETTPAVLHGNGPSKVQPTLPLATASSSLLHLSLSPPLPFPGVPELPS